MCVFSVLIRLPCSAWGKKCRDRNGRLPQAQPGSVRLLRAAPAPTRLERSPASCSRASTSTTASSAATSADAKDHFEAAAWAEAQRAVQDADRVLRRAGRGVRRAPPRRVRRRVARHRRLAGREALLHRPARRPHAARARRDVLQLRDHADPAPDLLRQRPDLRPRRDVDRVHRVGPADLSAATTRTRRSLRECFAQIFRDFGWKRPFADLDRDLDHLLRALDERPSGAVARTSSRTTRSRCSARAFYRNKAAYVVGKIDQRRRRAYRSSCRCSTTARVGSSLDAIVLDPTRSSTSSSRSRARTSWSTWRCPSGYVEFLRRSLPTQAAAELYTMLGLGKQGKTLFYPRPPAAPPPLAGHASSRRPARGAGDARLHAALVSLRLQGDQGRVRAAARTPTARPSRRSSRW